MATILGTPGNDFLFSMGDDVIVGLDGNDTVYGGGGNITVLEANGNDQIIFGGVGNDIAYLGDGTDNVELSGGNNRVFLGFGEGDAVTGSTGNDYIVAPGNHAMIDGMGGGDTIVLGGRHDRVIERYGAYDATGFHLTQNKAGIIDRVYAFNHSDRIIIEGDSRHPDSWHQGKHGVLWVDGAPVLWVGVHLTHHDLIFV